ncbi:hypothetical protein IC235_20900 [Hymenobacter sp. BT664]|uniref:Uncharacterized protein n=1 Tax=Hymenobacter montanus TaxID=2771359 RepID=A0A927BI66_9BACT|nr:hypothetical protein [Hymenobacter montanus]
MCKKADADTAKVPASQFLGELSSASYLQADAGIGWCLTKIISFALLLGLARPLVGQQIFSYG